METSFKKSGIFHTFGPELLDNFHKILTVSKYSHSEVGLGGNQKARRGEGHWHWEGCQLALEGVDGRRLCRGVSAACKTFTLCVISEKIQDPLPPFTKFSLISGVFLQKQYD